MSLSNNLLEGKWSRGTTWRVSRGTHIVGESLVTATKVLCIKGGLLAMTKNQRGWELPGGHIEKNEGLEEGTRMEMREETGITMGGLEVLGVMEITNTRDKVNKATGKNYPNPSYMLFYLGEHESQSRVLDDNETLDTAWFTVRDVEREVITEKDIISFFLEKDLEEGFQVKSTA